MKQTINSILLTGIFLGLAACASIDKAMTGSNPVPSTEQRQTVVGQFPELSQKQKESFIAGQPWVGMTTTHLKAMWNNDPIKSQKKLTASGNNEIQIYEVRIGDWKTGIKSKYYKVTVIEQKVVELQESDQWSGSLDKL